MEKETQLYFAYGSNLNRDDLRKYCKERGCRLDSMVYEKYQVAYLPDRALAFTYYSSRRKCGVLDIVEAKGSAVPGVIFKVDDAMQKVIAGKEGAPYERFDTHVILPDGSLCPVFTYQVKQENRSSFVNPSEEYLNVVKDGLLGHHLPEDGLLRAAENKTPSCQIKSVFVYGTLMSGECRHKMLLEANPIASQDAEVEGEILNLGGYPGLINLNSTLGSKRVKGELVEFADTPPLDVLDGVESFRGYVGDDNLFLRTLTLVKPGDKESRLAWIYVYAQDRVGANVINSGSWRIKFG